MMVTPCRLALMVLLAFALAACSPDPPSAYPPSETPVAAPAPPPLPAAAVIEAQRWLAGRLGVPEDEVEIVESEQQEWSDSCLGLGGPAESCLAAMTPGWRVVLEVAGERYEVRTDDSGQTIRSPDFPADPPGPPGGD